MSKIKTQVNEYAKNVKVACLTEVRKEKDALADADHAKKYLNANLTEQKHIANTEANSYVTKGTQALIENTNVYRKAFSEMTSLQADMLNQTKMLVQKSKDYSNQVGEALARIDKVLVKDFETKLILLERFVVASKEIVELEKSGALAKVANSFFKGH
jgi:hypothetical protein